MAGIIAWERFDSRSPSFDDERRSLRYRVEARNGIGYSQAGRLVVFVAVATVALMAWATKWQPLTVENRSRQFAFEN